MPSAGGTDAYKLSILQVGESRERHAFGEDWGSRTGTEAQKTDLHSRRDGADIPEKEKSGVSGGQGRRQAKGSWIQIREGRKQAEE